MRNRNYEGGGRGCADNVFKSVVAHMFTNTIEASGGRKDLLDIRCITFKYQMALPMSYIYTLVAS